jgi:hypothetical protein
MQRTTTNTGASVSGFGGVNHSCKTARQARLVHDRACRVKQCFRCYHYGHIGTQCNASKTCGYCAELHESKHCNRVGSSHVLMPEPSSPLFPLFSWNASPNRSSIEVPPPSRQRFCKRGARRYTCQQPCALHLAPLFQAAQASWFGSHRPPQARVGSWTEYYEDWRWSLMWTCRWLSILQIGETASLGWRFAAGSLRLSNRRSNTLLLFLISNTL